MYALAVGPFRDDEVRELSEATAGAGLTLLSAHGGAEAKRLLRQPSPPPRAVLLSRLADVAAFVGWMRGRADLFNVSVLAVVAHPSEGEFRRAFDAGADDVLVDGDALGARRRMQSLAEADLQQRPAAARGLALIAAADIGRRRQLGRTLRQAGFEVAFASEARELVTMSRANKPALVVATPSFPPMGGDAAVRSVRTATATPELPAVVLGSVCNARREPVTRSSVGAKPALTLMAQAVIASVDAAEQRRSKRVPYATICSFRASGLMEPNYGMTHDISRGGLYIRTLDPPPVGTAVWLELRTQQGVAVHLRGAVVWRRAPSQATGAAPAGFGVAIAPGACPPGDLEAFEAAYEQGPLGVDAIN